MSELKSKFVTESELDDKRKKRQEEWEKVRKPDQPLEAPEEQEVDKRSLFERLKEQKDRKDAEYEEQHKLKNQIRGLDSDEADFLEFVSQRQQELEKERQKEEEETLALLRDQGTKPMTSKPASADSQVSAEHSAKPVAASGPKKRTQADILSRIVKRKRSNSDESPDAKKTKGGEAVNETEDLCDSSEADKDVEVKNIIDNEVAASTLVDISLNKSSCLGAEAAAARVIGVLPGIGVYSNSSDTDSSSSDSEIDTDVFRRSVSKDVEKIIQAAHQH